MDKALKFISDQLNQALRNHFGISYDSITIGRLKNLDGSLPQENRNKLVLSLVNISLENSEKFVTTSIGFAGRGKASAQAPVNMSLYVLLAANYDDELEGLEFLSNAIEYFHSNALFDQNDSPEMPENIQRISLEANTLSFEELESVWNTVGCSALPSMLYKVRVFPAGADN